MDCSRTWMTVPAFSNWNAFIVDYKNAFELQTGEHSNNIILVAKTSEEKSNWMAALISLQTRRYLLLL